MEELCSGLRVQHGCGAYPVDCWKLARAMEVRVIYGVWAGRPHAVCFYPLRLILLNSKRSQASQRFDLAHELAHYVLGVERYHSSTPNQFAAELLMPASVFRLEALVHGVDGNCSELFGVNESVVKMRARELSGQR